MGLACELLRGRDVDHRLLRQGADELPNRGIATRAPEIIEPGRLELLDRVGESLRFCCRPSGRVGELGEP
jgi:hypothetical protein